MWQLDQVIISALQKALLFLDGVVIGRQHDDRNRLQFECFAVARHELDPIENRHNQVLQDDGRLKANRRLDRKQRIDHVLGDDRGAGQHQRKVFDNDRLVIDDEQTSGFV